MLQLTTRQLREAAALSAQIDSLHSAKGVADMAFVQVAEHVVVPVPADVVLAHLDARIAERTQRLADIGITLTDLPAQA
jgi:hypothetical protein